MGKQRAPAAPDYNALAQGQAAANTDAARITNRMNRLDEITPDGTRRYVANDPGEFDQDRFGQAQSNYLARLDAYYRGESPNKPSAPMREDFMIGGDPDSYSVVTELSPEAEQRRQMDNRVALEYSSLGLPAVDRARQILETPLDESSIPQIQTGGDAFNDRVAQALFDRTMSRLQPTMRQNRSDQEAQLASMGLTRGSEAWQREMDNLMRGENDALTQLGLSSTLAGGQEGRAQAGFTNSAIGQMLAQKLQLRSQPLNEIASIRSGSQITPPSFSGGVYQGANVGAAPIYQAGQDQYASALDAYRTRAGQSNAMFGALGTIGGGFMGGPAGAATGRALAQRLGIS